MAAINQREYGGFMRKRILPLELADAAIPLRHRVLLPRNPGLNG
jgi:hypothetical protein